MRKVLVLAMIAGVAATAIGVAVGEGPGRGNGGRFARAGADATWTTVLKSPFVLEGLTAGDDGNLYTTLRNPSPSPCQVVRVSPANTAPTSFTTVGFAPQPCSPSGLAFGPDGALYITGEGAGKDSIVRLVPDATTPPTATTYATGVPQANGIAFDRDGNLWATDGSRGVGTVWEVPSGGGAGVEAFRVPAMKNDVGVGRVDGTTPPAAGNPQIIVTNGIVFTHDGDILVSDTVRGAIWQVELDSHGRVISPVGCDTTYAADTLCLDDVLVQHPYLEGLDGITLDDAGNVWGAANERNAIVVVPHDGSVQEFFRNAPGADQLRNHGPLETPTSPVVIGRTFCVAQSDNGRRDNSPNTAGEVSNGGKVSCLDQPVDP
jgi:sugar lactone lactonase YvrE